MKASLVEPSAGLRVRIACGFAGRARGLLGRPPPAPGCGLLLPGTRWVHGVGLRHGLDLVYLDREGTVVACRVLVPGGVSSCGMARHVLEMRQGEIARLGLRPGYRPRFSIVDDIFGAWRPPPREAPTSFAESLPPRGQRSNVLPRMLFAACVFALLVAASPRIASGQPQDPGNPRADSTAPSVVDRYSGAPRRNRIRSARGSLNLHPADGAPARPLETQRSRKPRAGRLRAPLPPVEYLVGDPGRHGGAAGR